MIKKRKEKKIDAQFFYNGYRSVFKGQKRICVEKWVKHVYRVLNYGS